MNVAGLEPAPPGNRPGALITKPYVLIKLYVVSLLQLFYVVNISVGRFFLDSFKILSHRNSFKVVSLKIIFCSTGEIMTAGRYHH